LGFLTALDRLDPVDRAVFLLRDVFDLPYDQVAGAVDRTETACRQIASRARRRVRQDRPARIDSPPRRRELLDSFLTAVLSGDPAELQDLLTEDVVHISDGGAERHAARRPIVGRDRVARFFCNIAARLPDDGRIELVGVNGAPGVLVSVAGQPNIVVSFEFRDDRISAVHAVLNPGKLAAAQEARRR
ncbi:MAG: sigma factor-like helix-turn-helix DNA-binding protein, partial [Actinomycetota bacterium]